MRGATDAGGLIWNSLVNTFWVAVVLVVLGPVVHHGAHALTAVAYGGRIHTVEVLGLEVLPHLGWKRPERLLHITYSGHLGDTGVAAVAVAGAGATWLLSLAALLTYRISAWRSEYWSTVRASVVALYGDVLVQTLPVVGVSLRELPKWLQPHATTELHDGAVLLGVPSLAVLVAVFGYPVLVWLVMRRRKRRSR